MVKKKPKVECWIFYDQSNKITKLKKHDNFIKAKLYYFALFFETADICSIPSNINNIWKMVIIPGRRLKRSEAMMSVTKTTTGDIILLTSEININLSLPKKMK